MKKKEFDLTKEKDIQRAEGQLESECLNEFINSGLEICPFAVLRLSERNVEIGIIENDKSTSYYGHMAFASNIDITAREEENVLFGTRENQINFGSSGSFTPSCKESYWRTIHAATIIKNWDKACKIVNEYCAKYKDFCNRVQAANKKETETTTQTLTTQP